MLTLFLLACAAHHDSPADSAPTDSAPTSSTTTTSTTTSSTTTTATDTDTSDWAPECPAGTSDLAGVCIAFPVASVTFTLAQAAAGVDIPWAVVVHDPSISTITPLPQDAGGCGRAGASGLITFARVAGSGQSWCLCDTGLCMSDTTSSTLVNGVYRDRFHWDGRNWSGPSDTGNPEGPPFPAGTYTLTISAKATANGSPVEVSGQLPVVLTP